MVPKPMTTIEIIKFYTHQFKAAEALADNPDEIPGFLKLVEEIRRAKANSTSRPEDAVLKLMKIHLMTNLTRASNLLATAGLLKEK